MPVTERLARSCSRHPWRTVGGWLAAVLLAVAALALALGELTTEGHPTNNPESQRADAMIGQALPPDPSHAATDLVVVSSTRYTVDAPQFREFVTRLAVAGRKTGAVTLARIYYETNDPTQVSADRHATLIPILIPDSDEAGAVEKLAERADEDPSFAVAVTGGQTSDNDFNDLSQHDLKSGELKFGLPAALIILILVFGAIVAGLVPLLMAIISIVVALGLVAIFSQPFELSVFIFNMLSGMGLALGIDYSLFVVSRYREERGVGREQLDAIGGAGATASRAVLVQRHGVRRRDVRDADRPEQRDAQPRARGDPRRRRLGGRRADAPAGPARAARRSHQLAAHPDRRQGVTRTVESRRTVLARDRRARPRAPGLSLAVAVTLLVVLALPVLGLSVGANGVSTLPDRFVSKRGFTALQASLPARDHGSRARCRRPRIRPAGLCGTRAAAVAARIRRSVRGPRRVATSPDGDTKLLQIPVRGDPDSPKAIAAVRELRRDMIPDEFAGTGAVVLVGGDSAETTDYLDSVSDPAPYVLLLVLGLTFVLLTVVFRSVVDRRHRGRPQPALGRRRVRPARARLPARRSAPACSASRTSTTIEAWVPLFLFSVLFGLSMDYQVFLLSRIRERYDASGDTSDAVAARRRLHGADHHRRRADHRRRLPRLRDGRPGHVPADGLRRRRRTAARRDGHPLRRPARAR